MTDEFLGYFHVLHHLAARRMDAWNHDDVKDAFVEILMNEEHLTDEQLEEAVIDFYRVQQYIEDSVDAKKP